MRHHLNSNCSRKSLFSHVQRQPRLRTTPITAKTVHGLPLGHHDGSLTGTTTVLTTRGTGGGHSVHAAPTYGDGLPQVLQVIS
jgi:hypothetical protein